MGAPKRPFTTEYPEQMYFELKALARIQDRNVGWIIRDAVKGYLSARQPIVVLPKDKERPKPKPGKQEPPPSIEAGFGDQEEK